MKLFSGIEKFFFVSILLLVILPFLAPIFAAVELSWLSKPIYFIYSFFCHQFHTRSLYLYDHQCAWCARDSGMWIGFLAGSLAYKFGILKKVKWYWLSIFALPIALDGGIQTIMTFMNLDASGEVMGDVYVSNNFMRFVTGSFFGIGISLYLAQGIISPIDQIMRDKIFIKVKRFTVIFNSQFKRITVTMLMLMSLYITIIFLWNITSTEYKPTNALDSVSKTQEGFFFTRRLHGECPVTEETDILNLSCFF